MFQKLLTAKAWKIFMFTTALPFIFFILTIIVQISVALSYRNSDSPPPLGTFMLIGIFMVIVMITATVVHLSWMWSVATGLQQFMHPEMRQLNIRRFKLFFFIPIAYIAVIAIAFPLTIISIESNNPPNVGLIVFLFILMFCMHFFTMFCIIYVMYFVAKTFRSSEMQKEAHFSDYIGEFFLIWFFPVGIWFIQPRINAMVNGTPQTISRSTSKILDRTDF